jgi:hypothetical protein
MPKPFIAVSCQKIAIPVDLVLVRVRVRRCADSALHPFHNAIRSDRRGLCWKHNALAWGTAPFGVIQLHHDLQAGRLPDPDDRVLEARCDALHPGEDRPRRLSPARRGDRGRAPAG